MRPSSAWRPGPWRIAPLLALLLYAALALHQLSLPGFYYDEALDLVPALEMAQGRPATLMPNDPGLTVFGYTAPLMILDYMGTVSTYLFTPIFWLMGANWLVVRWGQVVIGLLIVALGHRVARAWFGPAVAALAALLLAVNPSFIFWSRMGISVSSIMSVCLLGALAVVAQWRRSGDERRWLWAGLLLGVGLWAKLLFLWWVTALPAVYGLMQLPRWREWKREWAAGCFLGLPVRAVAWGAAGFVVGAAPLLYYNLATGKTVEIMQAALAAPTAYGVNNLNLAANLAARLEQFRIFLDGSYFWYNGGIEVNAWAVQLYRASLIVVGVFIWRWPPARRRITIVVLLLITLVLAQSVMTLSGIWATHLFTLAPFPQILAALAIVGLWEVRGEVVRRLRPAALTAGVLIGLGLFGGDLAATWRYHQRLSLTGGVGRFSDAVYRLADALQRVNRDSPAALDWGLAKNVFVLTNGRVLPDEIFGYSAEPDEGFGERVRAALCEGCLFINTAPGIAVFPRDDAFRQIASEAGYTVQLDEAGVIRERGGAPVFVIYRVQR
jgi:4-amino-4-deoxy-L-arabinose transferase-like glycosyltransferase